MNYETKYKDAQKWIESIYTELNHERQMEAEAFFPELKKSNRGDTREELISFLEELSKLGGDTNFDKWTTSDCAKWIDCVMKQDPTWFEEELEKSYKNGYEDAKREILGLVDIESMAKAYEQRLINTMSNHPSITLSVASFIHGANCVLDELYLKKCQVKESDISQHETKTCEENNDSLTSEDEKIRKDIVSFLRSKNGYMNPCEDWDFHNRWIPWLEEQGEQKLYVNDNAKEMFIKALERVEEQNSKGYKLTDYDKNSWWEDFKAYSSEQNLANSAKTCKIELKFKVGDWIVDNRTGVVHCIANIKGTVNGCYYVLRNDKGLIHIDNESDYHLWTIQDAKDGDVLQLGEVTAIFKKNIGNEHCICYCSFCKDGGFEIPIANGVDNNYGCHNATPATKEQRDLLFQKMEEAGYEWNAEKKELTKIEQKQKKFLKNRDSFIKDLETLINQYCIDTFTDTPDFILADFLWRLIEQIENPKSEDEVRKMLLK